ncbi:aromatic-ring-hydroxylating dioxygenase subunit beta [Herbaspirillum sp. YR522]|uniref:aromatic-ring-hydroxylating dioxygenase subunit beta n=1 Tax=Herbaspirillum sp. YR522 TaxID=1144342 RepID=UPI00026FC511|nr:small subunit of phenylpropionate dioxygenase [Herbaspirillum sp. YR522]
MSENLQGIPESMAKAIAFIWKEAELLDRKDYAAWQDLWTDDGYYVVPIDPETTDFAATLNYAYDNAHMRKIRIERLTSGFAMSAVDAATTVRTVSRFVPVHLSAELVEITSAQVLVGYKRQQHTLFVGNVTHRIRFTAQGPKIEQKVIRLVNSMDSLNALGFLL